MAITQRRSKRVHRRVQSRGRVRVVWRGFGKICGVRNGRLIGYNVQDAANSPSDNSPHAGHPSPLVSSLDFRSSRPVLNRLLHAVDVGGGDRESLRNNNYYIKGSARRSDVQSPTAFATYTIIVISSPNDRGH